MARSSSNWGSGYNKFGQTKYPSGLLTQGTIFRGSAPAVNRFQAPNAGVTPNFGGPNRPLVTQQTNGIINKTINTIAAGGVAQKDENIRARKQRRQQGIDQAKVQLKINNIRNQRAQAGQALINGYRGAMPQAPNPYAQIVQAGQQQLAGQNFANMWQQGVANAGPQTPNPYAQIVQAGQQQNQQQQVGQQFANMWQQGVANAQPQTPNPYAQIIASGQQQNTGNALVQQWQQGVSPQAPPNPLTQAWNASPNNPKAPWSVKPPSGNPVTSLPPLSPPVPVSSTGVPSLPPRRPTPKGGAPSPSAPTTPPPASTVASGSSPSVYAPPSVGTASTPKNVLDFNTPLKPDQEEENIKANLTGPRPPAGGPVANSRTQNRPPK